MQSETNILIPFVTVFNAFFHTFAGTASYPTGVSSSPSSTTFEIGSPTAAGNASSSPALPSLPRPSIDQGQASASPSVRRMSFSGGSGSSAKEPQHVLFQQPFLLQIELENLCSHTILLESVELRLVLSVSLICCFFSLFHHEN